MHNLLILYNPYYKNDVIDQHLSVLLDQESSQNAKVAFGKIRSKLRDYEHPFAQSLNTIYDSVSEENYLQLFLTDYADLYVAKVIDVVEDNTHIPTPRYYQEKNLNVEQWFVLSDIRRVADDDFALVRDRILGNFTTPNFGGHHYAIYGNSYVYPLVVRMDDEINYFETESASFRYFIELFKNERYWEMKQSLLRFRFGEPTFYALHPNTQDAIVSAEIEYHDNSQDPLYDFSAVVIKLSKAFEKELYLFLKSLFAHLSTKENLSDISYQVQGRSFRFADYQKHKPNIGTNKYLLGNERIRKAMMAHLSSMEMKFFVTKQIGEYINAIQGIRNESTHGEVTSLAGCNKVRDTIIEIGESGVLCELVRYKRGLSGV